MELASSIPADIWRTGGITEHLGGMLASQRLLALCHIAPGQRVLDLGCGTGTTACLLAKQHRCRVVAMDVSPHSAREAAARANQGGVAHLVSVVCADVHHLPYVTNAFDAAIAESVLVFCHVSLGYTEIHRILKPGGVLGDNEMTFLGPPPPELASLLKDLLAMQAFQEQQWRSWINEAGFVDLVSRVHKMSLREQLVSHIQADGCLGYLAALVKGLANLRIRSAFMNRAMLRAARQFMPLIGYGLYAAWKKPEEQLTGSRETFHL